MLDYVLLFAVVGAVLLSMGGYFKRGLMNKYKETGDAFGHGRQYQTPPKMARPEPTVPVYAAQPTLKLCMCGNANPKADPCSGGTYYFFVTGGNTCACPSGWTSMYAPGNNWGGSGTPLFTTTILRNYVREMMGADACFSPCGGGGYDLRPAVDGPREPCLSGWERTGIGVNVPSFTAWLTYLINQRQAACETETGYLDCVGSCDEGDGDCASACYTKYNACFRKKWNDDDLGKLAI
jgi:hypothetical protein